MTEVPIPDFLRIDFATLILYATFIFFGIYSFVITYHWVRWAPDSRSQTITLSSYYIGSGILLAGMLSAYIFL
jgi:hypothetical protein